MGVPSWTGLLRIFSILAYLGFRYAARVMMELLSMGLNELNITQVLE